MQTEKRISIKIIKYALELAILYFFLVNFNVINGNFISKRTE